MKRLLLTTIARPLGKSEGTCSENILAERMRDEGRLEHLVNGLFNGNTRNSALPCAVCSKCS
ncbi:hypothetical protein ACFLR7_02100 [Acidobacteriota bacterium]